MLLAYRRGLLKPDYPNGIQSRLREKVLLDSLDIELAAERMQAQIGLVHTVCAPHYDSEKLENVISKASDKLDVLYRLKEYDVKYGARNLRRYIQTHVEDAIAKLIISHYAQGVRTIYLTVHTNADGQEELLVGDENSKDVQK